MSQNQILVAYHDVTWENCSQVLNDLKILQLWGITHISLGVVPFVTTNNLPLFVSELKSLQSFATLHHLQLEFLLHGYTHKQIIESLSFRQKVVGNLTNFEAEFFALNALESQKLLNQSLLAGELLCIDFVGFVPPTWHSNSHLSKQVLTRLPLFESRFFIKTKEMSYFSIPISIAGLSPWQQGLVFAFSKTLMKCLPGLPRLVLHPGELQAYKSEWEKLLQVCMKSYKLTSYRSLVESI